ncbi:MAG TPA: sigma-70 family RNA polymerase sigma factor [Microbacteriaceae bacterium]|nr:sigma-70 family RNA polymerase sigma factor [Microbacteriaceae bacterium]
MSRQRDSHLHAVLVDAAPALLAFFLRRVEPSEDAADLVSETFATVWKARGQMPSDPEAARMWCFGVARNVLLHHARSRRRRDALVDRLRGAIVFAPPPPLTDDALAVRHAVRTLPPELAELIRLVHWDGFTVAEAAELLDIPASTARSQHARAKHLLREALADFAR